jgi:hypothetical protein
MLRPMYLVGWGRDSNATKAGVPTCAIATDVDRYSEWARCEIQSLSYQQNLGQIVFLVCLTTQLIKTISKNSSHYVNGLMKEMQLDAAQNHTPIVPVRGGAHDDMHGKHGQGLGQY